MSGVDAPLRLLYFAGKYFPGSMAIAMHRQLLDQLSTHNVAATIVSLGPPEQRAAVVRSIEAGRSLIHVATIASPVDRLLNAVSKRLLHYDFFLSGARRLLPVVRGTAFDVAQGNMAFPFGAMLATALHAGRRSTPLVLNLAGGDLIDSPEARYGYARYASVRQMLRYAFGRAALVRANSETAAERALELGCPPARLRTVPVNITSLVLPDEPLAAFRASRRAQLRAALGLAEGPILLAAGRLSPIKGFDWIIRALPPLLERWPGLSLVIVGPTVAGEEAYAAGLTAEAERLGVGRHLHLTGPVELAVMRDYYAAADLMIISSLFEGLNKAGIEAGANGTPVITTSTTGLAAHIEASEAGLVIPPRDAPALAAAVAALLSDDDRRRRHAEAARRLADRFSPAAVARELVALYAAVAPSTHPWVIQHRQTQAPWADELGLSTPGASR